ncbi:hypothetical protein N7G274_006397 [Stereocaulon virgatum]|uniref:Uncharacterized protein n=1 Tax=Stereocaulon virgatum TaxID=373712 RepID=A0ABR4A866_9LECA
MTFGRCLGSRGELGFCVATGDGLLIDNGGSGCGGRTPDCDVASGTISQCPASFFNGINAASPASSQSPAESRSPHAPPGDSIPAVGLGSISTSRRKRVVQPEGAGA